MSRKLTILAVAINAVGHVEAVRGALSGLLQRGHRIIFMLDESFHGKLSPHGFEEHLYRSGNNESNLEQAPSTENPGESMARWLFDSHIIGDYPPEEKLTRLNGLLHCEDNYRDTAFRDGQIKEAIARYTPDCIYFDGISLHPAIYYSSITLIHNISVVPNYFVFHKDVPPAESGLPSIGANAEDVAKFTQLRQEKFTSASYNDLLESLGYSRFPGDAIFPEDAPAFTVYAYPEELNYPAIAEKEWFNLEVFNKPIIKVEQQLKDLLPEEFVSETLDGAWSGKWIYLSLGSMGSIDLKLMRRLVGVLGQTKHKYIVSKGPRHEEYSLAVNMFGHRYLPQMQIVPQVDLVITHGGNNTVTETFACGKPMLVLALFSDQFDNAQRIEEKGYGRRLNTYQFTDEELIQTIDSLLNDDNLAERLGRVRNRIGRTNHHQELAVKIEKLLEKVEN